MSFPSEPYFQASFLDQVFGQLGNSSKTKVKTGSISLARQILNLGIVNFFCKQEKHKVCQLKNDHIEQSIDLDQIKLEVGRQEIIINCLCAWVSNLKSLEDSLNFLLTHLNYVDVNKDNIFNLLNELKLPVLNNKILGQGKQNFELTSKWVSSIVSLVVNFAKNHYIPILQKDVKRFGEKGLNLEQAQEGLIKVNGQLIPKSLLAQESILSKIDYIQQKMQHLETLLVNEHKKARNEINIKNLHKLGINLIGIVLPTIFEVAERTVIKFGKACYSFYRESDGLNHVSKLRQQLVKWTEDLIETSPSEVSSVDRARSLLQKRQEDFEERVNTFLENKLPQHIQECQDLSFDQINHYVMDCLHVDLKKLPSIPKDREEWVSCFNQPVFCQALVVKHIEYQETIAILFKQGMLQAFLSKNSLELNFFNFQICEQIVGIVSSIIQIVLLLPNMQLGGLGLSVLKLFVADLTKLGLAHLALVYIVYPEMKLKIDGIVTLLGEYCFAIQYKPNEYCLNNYKIQLQIRWFQIVAYVFDLAYLFKQFFLWAFIRLIDKKVKGEDPAIYQEGLHYKGLNTSWKLSKLWCKEKIDELEKILKQSRLKDAALIFDPQSLQTTAKKNIFDDIQSTLDKANFNLFPKHTKEWFKKLNIPLTEESKKTVASDLADIFAKNGKNFILNLSH